jgi:hypothetical protein
MGREICNQYIEMIYLCMERDGLRNTDVVGIITAQAKS